MLDEYGNYVAIKLVEQARIFQKQMSLSKDLTAPSIKVFDFFSGIYN
jgi:hypothetical protein